MRFMRACVVCAARWKTLRQRGWRVQHARTRLATLLVAQLVVVARAAVWVSAWMLHGNIRWPTAQLLLAAMFDEIVELFPGIDGFQVRVGEVYLQVSSLSLLSPLSSLSSLLSPHCSLGSRLSPLVSRLLFSIAAAVIRYASLSGFPVLQQRRREGAAD